MRRQYDLICVDCRDSFTAFSKKALRCPTCQAQHKRELSVARFANRKKQKKQAKVFDEWYNAIVEINLKAYALGLSYGQYSRRYLDGR